MSVFCVQKPIGNEIIQKSLADIKKEILNGVLYVAVAPYSEPFECTVNVIFFKNKINGDMIDNIRITMNKVEVGESGLTLEDAHKHRVLYTMSELSDISKICVDRP